MMPDVTLVHAVRKIADTAILVFAVKPLPAYQPPPDSAPANPHRIPHQQPPNPQTQQFDGTHGPAAQAFLQQTGLYCLAHPDRFPDDYSKIIFMLTSLLGNTSKWAIWQRGVLHPAENIQTAIVSSGKAFPTLPDIQALCNSAMNLKPTAATLSKSAHQPTPPPQPTQMQWTSQQCMSAFPTLKKDDASRPMLPVTLQTSWLSFEHQCCSKKHVLFDQTSTYPFQRETLNQ
ncbi:uncharacterized protein VP01_6336g1 [Puccinia sorghi]|uniref:DUF4939 domain-containing protein n=1 Tax=Puccinia sorghi TaxID=27349 RepID=A0A0L6UG64_9BASI|nr:uncharacterized protein VP01_6336g1 [Puccinia sorghi]